MRRQAADLSALAAALSQQGLSRVRTGRTDKAAVARDEALALVRKSIGEASATAEALTVLAQVSARCARLLEGAGQLTEAEQAYVQAIGQRERRARGSSDDVRGYVGAQLAWAASLADLGRFHQRHGRAERAASCCTQARAVYAQIAASFPAWPEAQYQFARFLTTGPVESLLDPAQALRLAEKSLALDVGDDSSSVGTQGVAQYRLGNDRAAVASLDLAIRFSNGEANPEHLFFRALAHWRLGEKVAARRDYDEAIRSMALSDENWSELQQYRDEAAAVLGAK
jgi:tetratricopeptide (TPR) repeat protein